MFAGKLLIFAMAVLAGSEKAQSFSRAVQVEAEASETLPGEARFRS
jgi:hypothetical protein